MIKYQLLQYLYISTSHFYHFRDHLASISTQATHYIRSNQKPCSYQRTLTQARWKSPFNIGLNRSSKDKDDSILCRRVPRLKVLQKIKANTDQQKKVHACIILARHTPYVREKSIYKKTMRTVLPASTKIQNDSSITNLKCRYGDHTLTRCNCWSCKHYSST